MAKSVSLGSFPQLCIRHNDVASSFNEWLEDFELVTQTRSWELGTEKRMVDGVERDEPKFTPEARRLALLQCIGHEGRKVLTAAGLRLGPDDLQYDEAIDVLKRHYGRGDSLYVQTQKFVTVRQAAGEDYGNYLHRVESLSRSLNVFNHNDENINRAVQEVRSTLALVLAVNGLRDQSLCKELIAKDDLTWASLSKLLSSRSAAEESVVSLRANDHSVAVKVKDEIYEIKSRDRERDRRSSSPESPATKNRSSGGASRNYSRERSSYGDNIYRYRSKSRDSNSSAKSNSSYQSNRGYLNTRRSGRYDTGRMRSKSGERSDRSGSREREYEKRGARSQRCYECGRPGHTVRSCPEVRCYRCNKRGHLADDCRRSGCSWCGESHRSGERCRGRRERHQSPFRRKSLENKVNFVEKNSFNK